VLSARGRGHRMLVCYRTSQGRVVKLFGVSFKLMKGLMQQLFQNVFIVEEEKAIWSGRLPSALFKSSPSGIPFP